MGKASAEPRTTANPASGSANGKSSTKIPPRSTIAANGDPSLSPLEPITSGDSVGTFPPVQPTRRGAAVIADGARGVGTFSSSSPTAGSGSPMFTTPTPGTRGTSSSCGHGPRVPGWGTWWTAGSRGSARRLV